MDPGLIAAIRRHPGDRLAIQELALRSEGFRTMCADLAEAEEALRNWQVSDSPLGEDRCGEYKALVEALDAEIVAEIVAAMEHAARRR